MGADKFENEKLIEFGIPTDHWFHVDDLSSAHVYLRLNDDETIDTVNPQAIHECAVLVKANSIEGCKKNEVTILHTPWSNLHKTSDMVAGAIGHHDRKLMNRIKGVKKENSLVNQLNKTKRIDNDIDLHFLQQEYAREQMLKLKEKKKLMRQQEEDERKAREEAASLKSYDSVFENAAMMSNTMMASSATDEAAKDFEDDFM